MHTLYLFALLGCLLAPSLSKTTFYVDETNKAKNPDGSQDHPFPSLEDAFLKISPGTFDIILLGQSITINSPVIFPNGSICIIRPQIIPESGYYPLNFRMKASITIRQTNVTFQDIQLDYNALDPDSYLLIDMYGGLLLLNRTLVSDIQYPSLYFTFLSVDGDLVNKAALFLVDSQFKNVIDCKITTESAAEIMIQNTSFENFKMYEAFLTVRTHPDEEMALRMSNISLVNSEFRPAEFMDYSGGLVSIEDSSVNISIEGLSVKNVSLKNGVALIAITPSMDGPIYPTEVEIWDVILEDIVEIEDEAQYEGPEEGVEIFRLEGPFELTVRNLTARNIQFKSGFLLRYRPDYSVVPFAYDPYSQVSLQNIKIYESSNTNFWVQNSDSGQVEDVELVNVTSKKSAVFSFDEVGTVSMKNIYGRNISGPIISLDEVFSQNLENLTFENVSASQKPLIQFTGNVSNTDIVIANFFIDGYEYIGAKEEAYLLIIDSEIGTVLIRDSRWRNINTGGLLSHNMSALKVDNLTVENVKSSKEEGTLVDVNSDFVLVNNSAISGISGQLLFDLKGSSVKFDGVRISDIDCSEVKEACVLHGESVELEWEDTEIRDVVLQGDLVVLDEKSVEKGEVKEVNITQVE